MKQFIFLLFAIMLFSCQKEEVLIIDEVKEEIVSDTIQDAEIFDFNTVIPTIDRATKATETMAHVAKKLQESLIQIKAQKLANDFNIPFNPNQLFSCPPTITDGTSGGTMAGTYEIDFTGSCTVGSHDYDGIMSVVLSGPINSSGSSIHIESDPAGGFSIDGVAIDMSIDFDYVASSTIGSNIEYEYEFTDVTLDLDDGTDQASITTYVDVTDCPGFDPSVSQLILVDSLGDGSNPLSATFPGTTNDYIEINGLFEDSASGDILWSDGIRVSTDLCNSVCPFAGCLYICRNDEIVCIACFGGPDWECNQQIELVNPNTGGTELIDCSVD